MVDASPTSDNSAAPVFRQRWRDSQTATARPGQLLRQPRWLNAGLVALGVLLAAGAVTASTLTVEGESLITVLLPGSW